MVPCVYDIVKQGSHSERSIMVKRLVVALLVVVFAGSVCAEDAKEVVIASAEELKVSRQRRSLGRKMGLKCY